MCMVYETFLLTAVALLTVAVFLLVTQNRHSPTLDHALRFVLFLVTAAYFIHFWSDSGHTLAMKTWRIKVIQPGHAKLPVRSAAARFLLAWGWFLPALLACYAFNISDKKNIGLALLAGIAGWACTALFDKDGQFMHDRLAGTRLILLPKAVKKQTAKQKNALGVGDPQAFKKDPA